jgi:ribosome-binding factor A
MADPMEDPSAQPSAAAGDYHLPPPGGKGSRTAQVGSLLARTLQERLARGLHDPRYRGLVSILEVRVAPDLADATVHVSVLPAEAGPLSVEALRHAAGRLAADLLRATRLRRIPRLHFRLDDRLKRAAEVEASIRSGLDAEPSAESDLPSDSPGGAAPPHHPGETTP